VHAEAKSTPLQPGTNNARPSASPNPLEGYENNLLPNNAIFNHRSPAPIARAGLPFRP
jgi:hypothetical protein